MLSFFIILYCFAMTLNTAICYGVTCNYNESHKTMIIENLRTKLEFVDYLLRCGQENAVVLIYSKCYGGDILIPISDILDNYSNHKLLCWNCDGNCNKPDTCVDIIGSTPGKYKLYIL